MTCQLLQTSRDYHQLEIGSFTSFLYLLFEDQITLTNPTFITVLWEFICEQNIDLSHHSSPKIGPPQNNDKALMDILLQEHEIKITVKTSIDRVRGYL